MEKLSCASWPTKEMGWVEKGIHESNKDGFEEVYLRGGFSSR